MTTDKTPATLAEPRSHRWNDVGERCLDCGDKDWMGGPCSGPRKPSATLATAKHGGCVRLGDGLPPLPIRQRFTTLHGETYAYSAEQMREYALAALSAQPSPGGQGDAHVPVLRALRAILNESGRSSPARTAALDAAIAALAARQPVGHSFQADVAEWMGQCFLPSLYSNMTERGDRLLEEVLELLQAHGYDKARVPTLVDYVFGRPVGEPAQEVGGVMVTLAGYCWVAGLDMHANGQAELDRINQPDVMAKIRAKQEAKNALHFDTPLPGHAAPTAQTVDLGAERMFYIQDTRQFVGNCPMWWGPNGSGYVTRLDEAGRYTEQEAIKQNRTRDTDIPWPCAEIDAIARRTVDGQHMRPRAERLAELALVDSQAVGNG